LIDKECFAVTPQAAGYKSQGFAIKINLISFLKKCKRKRKSTTLSIKNKQLPNSLKKGEGKTTGAERKQCTKAEDIPREMGYYDGAFLAVVRL
jgi:hypothetical protein